MIKSLYVHIPFCIKKCLYCDFNSYSNMELQDEYVKALLREIDSLNIKEIETVFVGGGTPTALSNKNLDRVLEKLNPLNPREFTIEGNPGTLDGNKLEIMKKHGVNRISMGLQAWQDRLLKDLGRIHTLTEFLDNYESAKKFGFNNINIDLMFGLPGQTIEEWKETLIKTASLKPEHISFYGLIVEEGTPYYEMDMMGKLELPSEDLEREMYDFTVDFLQSLNYRHYEISNFAFAGYECKHNITYWRDEEYYGVGAGAHSYIGRRRISNRKSIKSYIDGVNSMDFTDEKNIVSLEDEMSEFMFLGLRMMSGIKITSFKKRFGIDIREAYPGVVEELINQGLLELDEKAIKLTSRGITISNQVFIKFIK